MKKIIFHTSRILLALVFLISSTLKAIDPLGTTFKLSDYFVHVFGLPEMFSVALPLAFILNSIEFILGITLLFNALDKVTSLLFWTLMIIFTPLTFYLALKNPITDCGCFGDAIKLTNWQTFAKNIVFIILFLPYQFLKKIFKTRLTNKCQKLITTTAILVAFSFQLYNYNYLPIIDFRPYKEGTNIKQAMAFPPDAPQDQYQTVLVYKNKKTGELKEFTEDNFPWQDTLTWQWVETRSKLIKRGYIPPIHDFAVIDSSENDITDSVLNLPVAIFIVSYDLNKTNIRGIQKVKKFVPILAQKLNAPVFWLTGSSKETINQIKQKYNINLPFYTSDETALKTFIRANPGIVILKQGTIVKKLHFHLLNKKNIEKLCSKI